MSETQPILFRKKRLQVYRGRGKLYSWLRAHRERIGEGLSTGEYTWSMLCVECSRHGVQGREGLTPDRTALWKAWQTLCRDLETLGETPMEKAPRPKPPSRFPKDWKPEAFRASAVAVAPAASEDGPQPYDRIRRREQIRRMINERSGIKE